MSDPSPHLFPRVSWVCDTLPATPKSATRGRRNSVLVAVARVEPLGEERMGRGGTRHDLLVWKVLEIGKVSTTRNKIVIYVRFGDQFQSVGVTRVNRCHP